MKAELQERPQSKRLRAQSALQKRRMGKQQAEDYFKKGKADQLNEQYSQAIDLYLRAILYDPNYFQAYCNLGSCYRLLGKYQQAKTNYLIAISLKKDDAITHYNIANLYRKIGNYDLATKHYEFVIRLKEEKNAEVASLYIDSLINIGICYKNLGLYEDAITIYQKVNQLSPKDEGGIFNHAMCIIGALQHSGQQFHELAKQRAEKANELLKKALLINSNNYMAQLAQIKLLYLLNNKQEVILQSIQSLKQLLELPNCNVLNEINEEIGYCLTLLKKYKESAKFYDKAINLNRSTSLNSYDNNVADLFKPFEDSPKDLQKQMVQLIERGQYTPVQNYINSLEQTNLLKHSLKLIMDLKLAQENPIYQEYAKKLYLKHFTLNGQCISFDKISAQTHRAIGQVLTQQKKYEEAVAHYEYVSLKLKNSNTAGTAEMHNSLGDGFEAVGDMSKALEQYKRAYELEPDNFFLSYNIGSCLYQNGRYAEAFQYFNKVLSAIEKDPLADVQTRNIYTADCLITMAFSSLELSNDMSYFEKAYAQLQNLKSSQIQIELDESNLFDFYAKLAQLYETKLQTSPQSGPQHRQVVESLLSVYESMLQSDNCLDRNEILFNCGTLYYSCKLYLTAIESYQQINTASSMPYGNISLAYLHLIEPALAIKYIELARHKNDDLITEVNRDIISWIYSNDNAGRWNSKLPQIKKDLFYERNQYGIALIDKLTIKINQNTDSSDQDVKLIIEGLFKDDLLIKFAEEEQNIKFHKIRQIIHKNVATPSTPTSQLMSADLLKASFHKSEHVAQDFSKLLQLLQKLPQSGKEQEIVEAAIYLYIYYNQYDSTLIRDAMLALTKIDRQQISLNLDQLLPTDEDQYSIEPSYDTVKKMITLLREWQCVLQKKIITIIKALQKIYYAGPIRRPFEIEYHFPRHSNLRECDETFQKLMFIILQIIQYHKKITCKGNNIVEMKDDLIKQFQLRFNSEIKFETLKPITLSNQFVLVTLYSYHQSRKDCEVFINSLLKLSSDRANVSITDCEEFVVTINKLVQVRCRWYDPYSLNNIIREVMENILDDPLYIVNQAIIALQKIREVVKEDGELGAKFIKQDSTLRF